MSLSEKRCRKMPVFDLAEKLEEIHWKEYAEFDNPPHYEPSLEYKRKIQKRLDRAGAYDSGDDNKAQS